MYATPMILVSMPRVNEQQSVVGNSIYKFLKSKLQLPINREKSGIRRPKDFQMLGFGFVPTYKKGEKGKYQAVVVKQKWQHFKKNLKELTRKDYSHELRRTYLTLESLHSRLDKLL